MNLSQLKRSRALWLAREKYRHARWTVARRTKDMTRRKKWWGLYSEALKMRQRRDRQIAEKSKGVKTVSEAGVRLVASFEGFRSHAYRDVVGVWTIGYGETKGVGPNTPPISQAQAYDLLRKRLNRDYAPAVVAANNKLSQNELDGFTSFVYNVGVGGVASTTRVGAALRKNKVRDAADAILAWDKAGGHALAGLTRRRKAERALILK